MHPDNHIYHGLGKRSFSKWHHIIRDLGVDVQKGVSLSSPRRGQKSPAKILKSKLILESISISVPNVLEGPTARLYIDNMTLSTNEHLAQFFQAADWFVKTQDERGGWPIPVRRKFASDFYPVLESGWYSGMGQGHALSLLSRAFALTSKREYAEACSRALEKIFDLPGTQHGVQAVFVEKYVWYEEYPTNPSTFVLNGFMYALLGLYDVKSLEIPGAWRKAIQLYNSGLTSLKTMLPLYDTGSGTFYDLRHFTVTGIAPNPARLDYHVTHINQLLTFATFEQDSIFSTTAERWIGYTQGDRAPHN
ncbi:unnamed protein product [Allacma fusca]|uniref:heparosan-N-sulfate-glucuronate 5-epimerase n=1 Tax=Allacma fusca TaxID=39272 RepID=A0A8J2K378_9HEXA|nr:unnamed protein product [Allacma fusca]